MRRKPWDGVPVQSAGHDGTSRNGPRLSRNRTDTKETSGDGVRLGVFVDCQNMYHSAYHLHHARLDYAVLLRAVTRGRSLRKAVAFLSRDNDDEQPFVDFMRRTGYEVREKQLKHFADGNRKADWDVGIAVEIIESLDLFDVVVLVSGDGDFLPLVDYCHRHGKRVEVCAFDGAMNGELKKRADRYTELGRSDLLMPLRF